LVNRVASTGNWKRLTQGSPNLLDGIDAGGAAVLVGPELHTCGKTPKAVDIAKLVEWLKKQPELKRKTKPLLALDCLSARYAPAKEFANVASGLLALPISGKSGGFLLWFKPETIQSFSWAGNPNELKSDVGPTGPRLTPRKSFELWRETVELRALPWSAVDLDEADKFQILASGLAAAHTAASAAPKKKTR
jgi:light-regulated signal transduction histidine kinase (bacteriophytochrome)